MSSESGPASGVLGRAIRAHRGGMRLVDLAAQLEIHHGTLSRLERGQQPSLATVLILARWLGWTTDQVIAAALAPPEEDR